MIAIKPLSDSRQKRTGEPHCEDSCPYFAARIITRIIVYITLWIVAIIHRNRLANQYDNLVPLFGFSRQIGLSPCLWRSYESQATATGHPVNSENHSKMKTRFSKQKGAGVNVQPGPTHYF